MAFLGSRDLKRREGQKGEVQIRRRTSPCAIRFKFLSEVADKFSAAALTSRRENALHGDTHVYNQVRGHIVVWQAAAGYRYSLRSHVDIAVAIEVQVWWRASGER